MIPICAVFVQTLLTMSLNVTFNGIFSGNPKERTAKVKFLWVNIRTVGSNASWRTNMDLSDCLNFLPSSRIESIFNKNDLGRDKIENRLKLLKEWLSCEDHLPDDIDERLLENFLYGCKANLEKTKSKLERYLVAKSKMTLFFKNRAIVPEDYSVYPGYKCFYASRNQTENGNRVIVMRLPSPNTNGFDFLTTCKYMILGFDLMLYLDKSVKYDFIYDAINFTGPMIAKINFTTAKNIFEVLYGILPYRTNSISVINTTPGFDIFMGIGKPLMPKKLKDRMKTVKVDELVNILPLDCLPQDYGGRADALDNRSLEIFEYLKNNASWCKKTERLKLVGPLPESKKLLYSFEEFSMEGSFRSLHID